MYTMILARAMDIDQSKSDPGPDFMAVRKILFDRVIPRLLDRLSSQGRSIKPCLVHGDLWDENCAIDMATGEPFAFDAGSLYAHNEYEIGYWRPPRHRLSNRAYVRSYKRHFPVSEPADEWDDRNLLYSMRFNIGCNVLIPASGQRAVVFKDMKTLCRKYYPHYLSAIDDDLRASGPNSVADGEELEDEGDGLKLTLDHTASEMGLRSSDLVKGLQKNDEGGQTMPTEEAQQESSDPEPLEVGESKEVLGEPQTSSSQEVLPHSENILVADRDTVESSQPTQPLLPEVQAAKEPAAGDTAAKAMEALPPAIHSSKPANKAEPNESLSTPAGNEEVVKATMAATTQTDTQSVLNEPPATEISEAEPKAEPNKALGVSAEDCEKAEAPTPAKDEIEISNRVE